VAARSVQAAPAGLTAAISATAAKGTVVAATVASLVKGTLKIMTYSRLKLPLGITAGILLAGGLATVVLSSDGAGGGLSTAEIFKKAQDKYASLTSYSDEGTSVATLNGTTITTAFTIKMARPNAYRIQWEQTQETASSITKTKPQSVWSAGEGDFLDMLGQDPKEQKSMELALAAATGISGNAAASIPGTFFQMNWGNLLGASVAEQKQQADEKVGDVDCCVFSSDTKGGAQTLWIGRQDFLIHQIRTVTSAKAMNALLEQAAKSNPGMALPTQKYDGMTRTETHTNIVMNPKLTPPDFTH
jgi:outer membrane lipoprotein-sorting protein